MKKLVLAVAALLMTAVSYGQQFFDQVGYRGAIGTVNWTSPWANWTPNSTVYAGDAGGPVRTPVNVSGDITTNTTWSSTNVYTATGTIHVLSGVTLTIEPGTIIRGNNSGQAADKFTLIVNKGGKINAVGTAAQPIVFTSGAAPGARAAGDWSGILLIGNGITNLRNQAGLPDGQGQYEALPNDPAAAYGGNNNADNSGTLKYVRIEYAGFNYLPNQEINGLTFAAVGSGTTVDFVQVSYANDDSFEWFGGAVNVKHLIAFAGVDDDFDCDEGYVGKGQFLLGVRHPSFSDQAGTSNGFEHDNNTGRTAAAGTGKVPNVNNPAPVTRPVFSNVTLVGPIRAGQTRNDLPGNHKYGTGVLLRSNNSTSLFNSIVYGYPTAVQFQNGAASISPSTHTKASVDSVTFNNVAASINSTPDVLFGQSNVPTTYNGSPFSFTTATWWATQGFDNTTVTGSGNFNLVNPSYTGTTSGAASQISFAGVDYSPTVGSAYQSGAEFTDPKLANFLKPVVPSASSNQFFEQVSFKGAMGTTNWASGWANWTPQSTIYPGDNGVGANVVVVSNDITTNTTWTSNNVYYCSGIIHVRNDATLTIQAGTVIRGNSSGQPADNFGLIITQGSKIIAEGTAANPIVFTSGKPAGSRVTGDWAGLIIIGKAKTNLRNQAGLQDGVGQYEALPNDPYATYGGSDTADNSGILKYVRVEYGGYNFLPNQEINGITFAAVGSATEVDYVQVSYANDDSFEWFGGSVNGKHLIALAGVDDDFDMDEGYNGRVQFALGVRHPSYSDQAGTSNGFEHDNNTGLTATAGTGKTPNARNPQPITRPVLSNVTLVGPIRVGETRNSLPGTHKYGRGLELRSSVSTSLFNSLVFGYPTGIQLVNGAASLTPSTQTKAVADSLSIRNTSISINSSPDVLAAQTNVPTGLQYNSAAFTTANWFNTAAFNNSSSNAATGLTQPFYTGNITGAAGQIDFSTVDFTLKPNSADLNGADFSNPKLLGFAAPADLVVSTTRPVSAGLYNSITIASTGVATINSALDFGTSFTVQNGGTLVLANGAALTGSGNVSIGNGANISIANAAGLTTTGNAGAFQNAGTRTFNAGANYTFNGTSAQVTGDGFTGANNLTIDNTNGVTVSAASRIAGALNLKAGVLASAGRITIVSTATKTGLIDDFSPSFTGSVSGTVRFERYNSGSFRLLSTPVTSARMSSYGAFCSGVRRFDEPTNTWLTVPVLCSNITLLPQSSHLVFNTGVRTSTFVGTANTGTRTAELVRSPFVVGGPITGWNAVGNPYPSPISWSAAVAIPGNTTSSTMAAWIWNSVTNVYGTITAAGVTANGANNIIAPGQGFILKRNSVGTTGAPVVFNNSIRVNTFTNTFLREAVPSHTEMIRMQIAGNGYNDEAVVYTQAGAEMQLDGFDAEKMHSEVAEVPSLYTMVGNSPMIVNAQAATTADRVIPMGIKLANNGTFTITATEISNFSNGKKVMLEDRKLRKLIDLSVEPAYTFDAEQGTIESRFVLHVTSGSVNASALAGTVIYSVGNEVNISFPTKESVANQVVIVDALGRVVKTVDNSAAVQNLNFVVNANTGIYFVKVSGATGDMTKRVHIAQ